MSLFGDDEARERDQQKADAERERQRKKGEDEEAAWNDREKRASSGGGSSDGGERPTRGDGNGGGCVTTVLAIILALFLIGLVTQRMQQPPDNPNAVYKTAEEVKAGYLLFTGGTVIPLKDTKKLREDGLNIIFEVTTEHGKFRVVFENKYRNGFRVDRMRFEPPDGTYDNTNTWWVENDPRIPRK